MPTHCALRGSVLVQAALLLGIGSFNYRAVAQDTAASGVATDAARALALELSQQAAALYDQGDFSAGLMLLERAYAAFPEPVLLYDIGRAHEGLGNDEAAIAAYRKYLSASPDAKNRGVIERRLELLEKRLEEQRRCAAQTAEKTRGEPARLAVAPIESSRSEERPHALHQVAPWVVTGVGLLTLASGGVLGLLAADRHALAQAEPDVRTAEQTQREAIALARAATITSIVGGVVMAAGATWGIVTLSHSRASPSKPPPVSFRLGPGTISLSHRF